MEIDFIEDNEQEFVTANISKRSLQTKRLSVRSLTLQINLTIVQYRLYCVSHGPWPISPGQTLTYPEVGRPRPVR